MKFRYMYKIGPIDYWEGCEIASFDETDRVLRQMPEPARGSIVFRTYVPAPKIFSIVPIFMCKAENNGTVYIFCDTEIDLDYEAKVINKEEF